MRSAAFVIVLLLAPFASAVVAPPARAEVSVLLFAPPFLEIGKTQAIYGWIAARAADTARAGVPFQTVRIHDTNGPERDVATDQDGRFELPLSYDARGVHTLHGSTRHGGLDTFGGASRTVVSAHRPSAPPAVVVAAGPLWDEATVSWRSPLDDGGAEVTGGLVTATPGGTVEVRGARSAIVPLLVPGAPTTIEVRAVNGIGPGAPTSASLVPPAPLAADLALVVTHWEVCDPLCILLAPGETYSSGSTSPSVRAFIQATLARDGAPVAGDAVHLRVRSETVGSWPDEARFTRAMTDGDGVAEAAGHAPHPFDMSRGTCRPIVAEASATYATTTIMEAATATLCRTD